MAFNAGCCDVEQQQLKWLRVLNYVIGLEPSPMYANYVLFNL